MYFSGLLGLVLLPKALCDDDVLSLAGDGAGAVEVPQLDADNGDAPSVVDEDKPEATVELSDVRADPTFAE